MIIHQRNEYENYFYRYTENIRTGSYCHELVI